MEFWRRHKRKVYVTLGVFGSGYLLYRLYDDRRTSLNDLEKQLAYERESDELVKAQLRLADSHKPAFIYATGENESSFLRSISLLIDRIQAHFESIQIIADSTTLPHAMHLLDTRLSENLDLTPLTERLIQGKGQPTSLTMAEKLELWDQLKIQSFTKMVSSLWAMTLLSLYIRVQVNILGRHLYIDTARGLGISQLLEEAEIIDKNDEQQFLACADYLSNFGLLSLISDAETATSEVLKGKQVKDFFNSPVVHDTLVNILETLMIRRGPSQWVGYLMPEDGGAYKFVGPSSSSSGSDLSNATKFELLMGETRAVLSSAEFGNIVDVSLRAVVDQVLEDLSFHCGENNLISGMPLARLMPRITHTAQLLLTESNRSRYIQMIRNIPQVEQFFTLLYSSTPTS